MHPILIAFGLYAGTGVLVGIEIGQAGKENLWEACGGCRPDMVSVAVYWGYLITRSMFLWPFDL